MLSVQIISYVILPLTLAYITTVITKNREVRLNAQGRLLEHRVQAYIEVYRFIRKNFKVIIVPQIEEKILEYPSYLGSIERLEQYNDDIEKLLLANGLYLESELRSELENLQTWTSELALLLKAFRATENDARWNFDSITRRDNERYACSLMGIALKEDLRQFYVNIESILITKLRHPKIRKWNFKGG